MATPWIDSIRRGRRLNVYKDESMGRGHWRGVFDRALTEFNALAQANSFGVTMVASDERPARRGLDGAEVMVAAASGRVTLPYDEEGSRQEFDVPNVLHGKTKVVAFPAEAAPANRRIKKCFVYIPSHPTVNSPDGPHTPGSDVLLTVLVHEFVHCCGVSDADHHSNFGVFQSPFQYLTDVGSGESIARGGYEGNLQARMPPIVIDDQTPELIRPLWEPPATSGSSPAAATGSTGGPSAALPRGRGPLGRELRHASFDSPGETSGPGRSRRGRPPGSLGRNAS